MRLRLTVTHRPPSSTGPPGLSSDEVDVDAPAGSTVGALVDALAHHLGADDDAADPAVAAPAPARERLSLVVGGTVLDPRAAMGEPPLLDGAAVSLRRRASSQGSDIRTNRRRRAIAVLAVVHGPDCGRTIDLHPGRHRLGRSSDAEVRIDDASLSRLHTEVRVEAGGVTVQDLDSTNGTLVDGEAVTGEPVTVTTASTIHVGDTILALRHAGVVPAATTATGEGTLSVNRRPRVPEHHAPAGVALPTRPEPPRRSRVPWVAALLPLPVAAVLAVVVGPTMLAFALMGPVLMLGTSLSDRWGGRRTYAAELASYDRELRAAEDRVDAACRDELRSLARSHPDPAMVAGIAAGPSERVWERRRGDDDALTVAIGRCRRDASVRLTPPPADEVTQPQIGDAPCTLSLADVGVLGLCGDRDRVTASARWLIGQLVTLHSPADLQVVCLPGDDEAAERWRWVSRVPHSTPSVGEPRSPSSETPAATATTAVTVLATAVRDREGAYRATAREGPTIVVVLDGVATYRSHPDLATVLADGPGVGVVCLALDDDRSALPHEAGAVLELPHDGSASLHLPGHRHQDLVVDGVAEAWAERLSRSLAPLRDATPSGGVSALPSTTGLLACRSPSAAREGSTRAALADPTTLAEAWRRRPHRTSVPVGVCSTGTFTIDLAADGPHVLVAGTTGAGKSELLRTLVASLALHNTPQHLSFVLVDYKGGAAFRDCAELPHVAGVVTDLDDHLAARALTSLTAEITRRERLLRDADATDFLSYQSSPAGAESPLARLVVVVDEFRALAEELPSFVDGLLRVASLGRSLGIHLVLATQRPAGVVTADIKANVNLRIALRMRDRVDSEDVIDSPAAAGLDPAAPGRAHARTGGGRLVEFQAAHVGSAAAEDLGPRPIRVRRRTRDTPTAWTPPTSDTGRTELATIVDAVLEATAAARLDPAPAAWLPPLPAHLPHSSLPGTHDPSVVHFGLVDLPEQQRQDPLAFDLRARGHWAVVGGPGSGRSTTLLTLVRSLCAGQGPERLHVYAVSGGSLAALTSLAQVGASIDWSDTHRVTRLVARLSAEVGERRAALARRGCTTLDEWRSEGDGTDPAPPPMLLLVDDWELAVSRHDDLQLATLVDRLLALLREGEQVGLTAVLAGDRSLLLGRVGATVSHRVLLRLADPLDAALLGLAPRQVAVLHRPGQGLTSDGHLVQLALPPDPLRPGGPSGTPLPPHRGGRTGGPLRVDPLPDTVREDQLAHHDLAAGTVVLGIGGDDAATLGLDPDRDGRRWLIAGSAGSGVSTALLLVARSLCAAGRPVAVVALRGGPLDTLRSDPAIAVWCDGTDNATLVAARRRTPSLAVVVDTADELLDHPVEPVLREVSRLVDRDDGLLVVGASSPVVASSYRGLAVEIARHRTGILLGPSSSADAQALGVRVPADRESRPGRGHLVRRGDLVPVQLALPTAAPAALPTTDGRGSVTP
ncbi:FtsK/SpoIIIE domain-containing protein [Pedococcus sp. KACC 23699]|uniref:FtsK/SpoIIIE domain-containing protein n=1 Tax=Pedococcus sp. KACC 23699 TaxID=3149228 RepID=A0AAU7JVG7_9MICO